MASQTPSYGQILSLSYPRTRYLGGSPTVVNCNGRITVQLQTNPGRQDRWPKASELRLESTDNTFSEDS